MSSVSQWFPPSPKKWELIGYYFQFFPIITIGQWFGKGVPKGKTSIESSLNLPGKWAWLTMEIPPLLTLIYVGATLPKELGIARLPLMNWVMAAMFVTHYTYRAVLAPLFLNPSMSPCHLQIWAASIVFNIVNGLNIGGWLFGYGPRTDDDWAGRANSIYIGSAIWAVGLLGNMYHENVLREIRREAGRRPKAKGGNDGSVQKVYVIPKGGLFEYVLYPHYLCEWVEWIGFWMIAGWSCGPVRTFVAASISNMTPTAVHGWHWYVEKFGRKEVGQRMAVVPGLL